MSPQGENTSVPIGIEEWVGANNCLDVRQKRKMSCPCRHSNDGSHSPKPSQDTYYAIPAICDATVPIILLTHWYAPVQLSFRVTTFSYFNWIFQERIISKKSHVTAKKTKSYLSQTSRRNKTKYGSFRFLWPCSTQWRTRWRGWLSHCATNRKVAGSIRDVVMILHCLNPSRSMVLGSTQPLTEMSTEHKQLRSLLSGGFSSSRLAVGMTTIYAKSSVLRKETQTVRLNFLNIAMYFFTIFISTLFSKRILPHYQLYLM